MSLQNRLSGLAQQLRNVINGLLERRAEKLAASSAEQAQIEQLVLASPVKTILILGASGFIGARLLQALQEDGHQMMAGIGPGRAQDQSRRSHSLGRSPIADGLETQGFETESLESNLENGLANRLDGLPANVDYIGVDYQRALSMEDWLAVLQGVDVVINCVGIINENAQTSFSALHAQAPAALFQACQQAEVGLVIHFSALGADQDAASAYHLSKKAGDDVLRALTIPAFILQPSLIYGPEGSSTLWFTQLASLPLHVLPGRGRQMLQPIHVNDVVALVGKLVRQEPPGVITVPVAGPEPISLRAYLAALRQQMGLGKAAVLALPMGLARAMARLAPADSLMTRDNLAMLERGSTADISAMQSLLGRAPRPASEFVTAPERQILRQQALLAWGLPMLRWSLALVWIVTGVLSMGIYPVEQSLDLLSQLGLQGQWATLALYGAATLDIALGLGILLMRNRQGLWALQIMVILTYTVLLSVFIPEFWLHPFGPLLKNIPMLAMIYFIKQMERGNGISAR